MMKRDQALVDVMKGNNRCDPVFVEKALLALDRIVPPRDGVQASQSLAAVQDGVAETRSLTENIFNYTELKRVSESLDWSALSRLLRNGKRTLEVHNKTLPDENLQYRVFDFANRVVKYSNLPDGRWGSL